MIDWFTSIDALSISTRLRNCLTNEGIGTIGHLVSKSPAELLRIPELGRKTLKELEDTLRAEGWELARSGGRIREYTPPSTKPDALERIADALEAIAATICITPENNDG